MAAPWSCVLAASAARYGIRVVGHSVQYSFRALYGFARLTRVQERPTCNGRTLRFDRLWIRGTGHLRVASRRLAFFPPPPTAERFGMDGRLQPDSIGCVRLLAGSQRTNGRGHVRTDGCTGQGSFLVREISCGQLRLTLNPGRLSLGIAHERCRGSRRCSCRCMARTSALPVLLRILEQRIHPTGTRCISNNHRADQRATIDNLAPSLLSKDIYPNLVGARSCGDHRWFTHSLETAQDGRSVRVRADVGIAAVARSECIGARPDGRLHRSVLQMAC